MLIITIIIKEAEKMQGKKSHDILQHVTTILFGGFSLWWIWIQLTQDPGGPAANYFSDSYGILSLFGGLFGLIASKKWGGFKSVLGRGILFFAIGLFFQAFGQITYSYYAQVLSVEAPYPSLGDVGFFGSIPFYILGVLYIGKTVGAKISLKSYASRMWAGATPIILLIVSYLVFLRGYEFSGDKLTTILDFGYPLGQAFYVSLALLAYLLSRKLLGGIMRNKILLVLFALFVQYIADFMFLYKFSRETWTPGGINDFTYLVAYMVMITALLRLGKTNLITNQSNQPEANNGTQ